MIAEILEAVAKIGGKLWLEMGQLCYELPEGGDELLEPLRANKTDLIQWLEANHTEPPTRAIRGLPFPLERLVSAAANGRLPTGTAQLGIGLVPDLNAFVLGWAASYLTGATDDATKILWIVHDFLQDRAA